MYYNKVEICGVNTSKLKVLTGEEKTWLLRQAKTGDEAARCELIDGNLRLVLSIIQRFTGRHENPDDLFQVGCIGLIKAIDNFNTELDVKFSTYAVPKIAGEIRRFLRDDGTVKVSRSLKERAASVKILRQKLTAELGREPTLSELSEKLGLTPEEIAEAETATASARSIQSESGEEGFSLEDVLTDGEMEQKMLESICLRSALEKLSERERLVIDLRYFHGLTQQRVAVVIGVSQVQVSRIEKKALEHLRECF